MTATENPTRSYVRLSEDEWSKARADWSSGTSTLSEISDRTGASIRSLQNHFRANGTSKGEAMLAASNETACAAAATFVEEADPKAAVLEGARRIERAIIGQLAIVEADPTQGHRVGSVLKSLDAAAAALSRVYALKKDVLNLDRISNEDLPILEVRVLTDSDVREIRHRQEEEDEGIEIADDPENEIINLS